MATDHGRLTMPSAISRQPLTPARPSPVTRRQFLAAALLTPAALQRAARGSGARYVGAVPLAAPGASSPPFGRLLGDGLDARLFTDLSQLCDPQSTLPPSAIDQQLAISNQQFFVRTAAPSNLGDASTWTVRVGGLVKTPANVPLRDLDTHAGAPIRVLLECSGNADPLNYGLL